MSEPSTPWEPSEPRVEQEEPCQRCGAPEAGPRSFMRVMSFLVFTRHARYRSWLCPDCAAQRGALELGLSCLLGWWGIPWGLLTFAAIWTNGRTLLRSNLAGVLAGGAILSLTAGGFVALGRAGERARVEREEERRAGNLVDESVAREFRRAEELMEQGQPGRAIVALEHARRSAPDSAAINGSLGIAHLMCGDAAAARTHLERALRRDPADEELQYALAAACRQLGDAPGELASLRGLALRGSDEPGLHRRVTELLIETAGREAARAFVDEVCGGRGESATCALLLGQLAVRPGDVARHMRRALELEPELLAARQELARALVELGDLGGARELVAELPQQPGLELVRASFDALLAMGEARFDEGVAVSDRLVELAPEEPGYYVLRAQLSGPLGRYDDARRDFARARELSEGDLPGIAELELERAGLLLSEGLLDEAREALAAAREASAACGRERIRQLYYAARLDGMEGDHEAAARRLEAAPPGEDRKLSWRTLALERGVALARLARGEDARTSWRGVAASSADSGDWETRPCARLLLGELEPEAYFAEVQPAGRFFENDAHYYVGLHHELAGRAREAVAEYRTAVETSVGHDHPWQRARHGLSLLAADEER